MQSIKNRVNFKDKITKREKNLLKIQGLWENYKESQNYIATIGRSKIRHYVFADIKFFQKGLRSGLSDFAQLRPMSLFGAKDLAFRDKRYFTESCEKWKKLGEDMIEALMKELLTDVPAIAKVLQRVDYDTILGVETKMLEYLMWDNREKENYKYFVEIAQSLRVIHGIQEKFNMSLCVKRTQQQLIEQYPWMEGLVVTNDPGSPHFGVSYPINYAPFNPQRSSEYFIGIFKRKPLSKIPIVKSKKPLKAQKVNFMNVVSEKLLDFYNAAFDFIGNLSIFSKKVSEFEAFTKHDIWEKYQEYQKLIDGGWSSEIAVGRMKQELLRYATVYGNNSELFFQGEDEKLSTYLSEERQRFIEDCEGLRRYSHDLMEYLVVDLAKNVDLVRVVLKELDYNMIIRQSNKWLKSFFGVSGEGGSELSLSKVNIAVSFKALEYVRETFNIHFCVKRTEEEFFELYPSFKDRAKKLKAVAFGVSDPIKAVHFNPDDAQEYLEHGVRYNGRYEMETSFNCFHHNTYAPIELCLKMEESFLKDQELNKNKSEKQKEIQRFIEKLDSGDIAMKNFEQKMLELNEIYGDRVDLWSQSVEEIMNNNFPAEERRGFIKSCEEFRDYSRNLIETLIKELAQNADFVEKVLEEVDLDEWNGMSNIMNFSIYNIKRYFLLMNEKGKDWELSSRKAAVIVSMKVMKLIQEGFNESLCVKKARDEFIRLNLKADPFGEEMENVGCGDADFGVSDPIMYDVFSPDRASEYLAGHFDYLECNKYGWDCALSVASRSI